MQLYNLSTHTSSANLTRSAQAFQYRPKTMILASSHGKH